MVKARTSRTGRKPVGKGGVKISESYRPFSCLLEPEIHATLSAISTALDKPQREVIEAAIPAFLKSMPAQDQALVRTLIARRLKANS